MQRKRQYLLPSCLTYAMYWALPKSLESPHAFTEREFPSGHLLDNPPSCIFTRYLWWARSRRSVRVESARDDESHPPNSGPPTLLGRKPCDLHPTARRLPLEQLDRASRHTRTQPPHALGTTHTLSRIPRLAPLNGLLCNPLSS